MPEGNQGSRVVHVHDSTLSYCGYTDALLVLEKGFAFHTSDLFSMLGLRANAVECGIVYSLCANPQASPLVRVSQASRYTRQRQRDSQRVKIAALSSILALASLSESCEQARQP